MREYANLYKKSDNIALRHNYFIQFEEDRDGKLKISEKWISDMGKNMNTALIRNKVVRSIQHRKLKSGLKFSQFYASSSDQLLVGFGDTHIHETSLNFHHVYGNPYISGSMLKGISRAQAVKDVKASVLTTIVPDKPIYLSSLNNLIDYYPLQQQDCDISALRKASETKIYVNEIKGNKIEGKEKTVNLCETSLNLFANYFDLWWEGKSQNIKESENEQLKNLLPEFWFSRIIFGSQGEVGNINFYDAYTTIHELDMARFTPHNQDYFKNENKVPPADYQQPIPLSYLAIPKKSRFFFELSTALNCPDEVFQKAEYWLKTALEKQGVGAKTSSGFGYFSDFELPSEDEIKSSYYGFLNQKTIFALELKEGKQDRVEEALVRLKDSKLTKKNESVLVKVLATEEFYAQYIEKAEIIQQISAEIEEGCLQDLSETEIRDILKTLELFATKNQTRDIRALRRKLFPVEIEEDTKPQINISNLKAIFAEIKAGKHEEIKKELCQEIIDLLSKRTVKRNLKAKFIDEVHNYCSNIIKSTK